MIFNRKKRLRQSLIDGLGKLKTETLNFDLINLYHGKKNHSSQFQVLSEQTCTDLDIHDFFNLIDRTSSKIGQQYLYHTLKTPSNNPNKFIRQEKLINLLNQHKTSKTEIQLLLSKLNSTESYYISNLFQDKLEEKPKWLFIIPLMSFTMISSLFLSFFYGNFMMVVIALLPIHVAIHYLNKVKVNLYINSIPQLLSLGAIAKKIFKIDFIHNLYNETSSSIKVIDRIKRRMSFFKLEQKIDSDLEIIYWFILEFFKITFLLEPLLLFSVIKKLKNKTKQNKRPRNSI